MADPADAEKVELEHDDEHALSVSPGISEIPNARSTDGFGIASSENVIISPMGALPVGGVPDSA